jgi:hypothetical protein
VGRRPERVAAHRVPDAVSEERTIADTRRPLTAAQAADPHNGAGPQRDLRQEVAEGLLYAHSRLNSNTSKTLEAASFLYALVELLEQKGLITIAELDEHKRIVGHRLAQDFRERGMGAMLQDPEYDKYTFQSVVEIDCQSHVHLCQAVCCRLPFALSRQDIREGILHWDLGQPYLIAHNEQGACCHLDPTSRACTAWANRPVPCRAFDCRQDKRIWLDFERMIINPDIRRDDWPQCLAPGERSEGRVDVSAQV